MNKYVVLYTMRLTVEAEDKDAALKIAAEQDLNDFNFVEADVEEVQDD